MRRRVLKGRSGQLKIHRRIESLCQGLPWQNWDAVLAHGRYTCVPGNSWLENAMEEGETTVLFLSGRVGLRALPEDVCGKEATVPYSAPAVLSLADGSMLESAHWVLAQSTVCFFTPQRLLSAFATAPKFASNLVAVLHDQATHSLQYTTRNDDGLRRLTASLLARSTPSGDRKREVIATQSQLATETGLSRQWVNRLLKELETRGIAECGRGHIVLNCANGLETSPT